jgi:hypothetical protein
MDSIICQFFLRMGYRHVPLLGVGIALVYRTLLAATSDIADPIWRAISLDICRFWRDLGFVVGAVAIGFIANLSNISIAIQFVACIVLASGIFVLIIMKETKNIIDFLVLVLSL